METPTDGIRTNHDSDVLLSSFLENQFGVLVGPLSTKQCCQLYKRRCQRLDNGMTMPVFFVWNETQRAWPWSSRATCTGACWLRATTATSTCRRCGCCSSPTAPIPGRSRRATSSSPSSRAKVSVLQHSQIQKVSGRHHQAALVSHSPSPSLDDGLFFLRAGLRADAVCPCAASSEVLTVSFRRPGRTGANATGRGILSMQGLSYGVVRVDQENSLTSLTLQDCGHVMPGGNATPTTTSTTTTTISSCNGLWHRVVFGPGVPQSVGRHPHGGPFPFRAKARLHQGVISGVIPRGWGHDPESSQPRWKGFAQTKGDARHQRSPMGGSRPLFSTGVLSLWVTTPLTKRVSLRLEWGHDP